MESPEVSAKTVEEAVQKALEQLGLSREEVEVTILKKGKPGFLGLGGEEATVRVTPLPQATEGSETGNKTAALAKEVLEELLRLMKLNAEVELKPSPSGGESLEMQPITLEIKGNDLGILIGRRGQTLASLQHLLRLIIARYEKARVSLNIDVEGYKQRRYQALRELALNLAQKVKSTGQLVTLEPMPSDERRVIHLALSVHPEVATKSVGDGEVRKVVILPRKR
jgi:spoIIIJ-associated protein